MHEIAHQDCANEQEAKAVEKFYSDISISDFKKMEKVDQVFEEVYHGILDVDSFVNKGTAFCNDDDGPAPKLGRESFCAFAGHLHANVAAAINIFDQDSFKRSPSDEKIQSPSANLYDATQAIERYCYPNSTSDEENKNDKETVAIKNYVVVAKKSFDEWISDYSQRSRYKIHGFSIYPVGNTQIISCKNP